MSTPKKRSKPLQLIMLILLILLMILSLAVSFIPVGNAQEPETEVTTTSDGLLCADDQVLVKFKTTVSDNNAENMLAAMSSEALGTASDIVIADVPAGETVESFVASLEDQPNVVYAQPNYVYTIDAVTVNDTYVGDQWYLGTMGVSDAWDDTMGNASVVVAVLDTGVDLSHPDLSGQFVSQTDVVDNDGNAQDDDGHGTHVAGIIGAVANNSKGVAGIAPGAKLMPVDVFGHYETSSGTVFGALTSKVIEGIGYAVTHGADVINLSLGGSDYDSAFEDAVDAAVSAGVVVVAAAGNDGEQGTHYPSDFDSCISVIATDWNNVKASYSNYGEDKDISAPGGDTNADPAPDSLILSTYYDPDTHTSGYGWMDGTSMASPMVAGVAALMLSEKPGMSVDAVKNLLYSTAMDLGTPGRDNDYGYGLVDAQVAITQTSAYTAVSVTGIALNTTTSVLNVGDSVQLTETISPSSASNKAVLYMSSNPAVATVDYATGLMTAAGAGSAVITASTDDGGFSATCNVSVITPITPVTGVSISGFVSEAHTTHLIGESFDITPVVTPQNATNKAVKFESSSPNVASINSTGHINVVGVGSTMITVTTIDNNHSSFIVLDVLRRGDANGDGNVSITDYSLIRLHILGLKTLSSGLKPAADIDKNGSISISDYTLVRLHILGLKSIDQ